MSVSVLRDLVSGPVIDDEDPDYEDARHVYNFMIKARPYAIVRCASAKDVQAVVEHATVTDRNLAVRGGGHSVPGFGTADGAICSSSSRPPRTCSRGSHVSRQRRRARRRPGRHRVGPPGR